MVNSNQNHKYWLSIFFFSLLAIFALHQFSVFSFLNPKITRNDATKVAEKFLASQSINTKGFFKEAFFDNSNIEIKYLIKKLGNKKFKEFIEKDKNNLSWTIMFYQDLPKQIPQTTYWVDVNQEGKVFGFRSDIPDSLKLNSISKAEAIQKISNYLSERIGNEFAQFDLIEIKEEQLRLMEIELAATLIILKYLKLTVNILQHPKHFLERFQLSFSLF